MRLPADLSQAEVQAELTKHAEQFRDEELQRLAQEKQRLERNRKKRARRKKKQKGAAASSDSA